METKSTGPKLFLRYAYPCRKTRFAMGSLTHSDIRELELWFTYNTEPEPQKLASFFPKAFTEMSTLAKKNKRYVWSLENVSDYWHLNHSGTGECGVQIVVIDKKRITEHGVFYMATLDNRKIPCFDLTGEVIKKNDKFYVHKCHLIEKI